MKNKWSDDDISYLIENYENSFNIDISKKLNRTELSITNKANDLKLKKSKLHKSKCISKRNKIVGRDLTDENLKIIALSYKTKTEFQMCDPSAYSTSIRRGIINDVCSHMINQNYSIPQLILKDITEQLFQTTSDYNNRKIINPYEIDVYYQSFSLGFEYNGKGWHSNNVNDKIKMEICKNNKINLIILNERSRKYEDDIKKQLCENIELINKVTNLSLTENDIFSIKIGNIYSNLLDIDEIKNTISKYENLTDFMKNEINLYNKIIKTNQHVLLNKLKRKRHSYSIEELKIEIEKYEYLLDFIKKSKRYYIYIHKHNLCYMLDNLKRK